MEIEYRGANCLQFVTKKTTLITDGNIHQLGLSQPRPKGETIWVATEERFLPSGSTGTTIDGPGEYEIQDISLKGIPAKRMIDADDTTLSTIYRMVIDGVVFVILGHISAPLDEVQLEAIGVVDVVILPVGGGGYTLDEHQAATIVRQLDPLVVIPTHYADAAIGYEIPQNSLDEFIKEMGAKHEVATKFKIKNAVLPQEFVVMELSRTS